MMRGGLMQIEIDFEVYKELTARRRHEEHSYNEVLRELLKLPAQADEAIVPSFPPPSLPGEAKGFALRTGTLPDGTKLKAAYKKKEYRAAISNGRWIDEAGNEHSSPSAAASAISKTNVNGLRFWHAKRPHDRDWTRLDILLARP